MKQQTKRHLIIAAILLSAGAILFCVGMTVLHWDFTALSTETYETNTYPVEQGVRHIVIETETADVMLVPADTAQVVCYEQDTLRHTVTAEGDTLKVAVEDTRKWYEYVGISFHTPHITVYLPQGAYGSLSIKGSTGGVELPKAFTFEQVEIQQSTGDVTCHASASGAINIRTSTGRIRAEGLSAASLSLSVTTGLVTVSDVTCQGEVDIRVSTGKAALTDLDCGSLTSHGSTGDVTLKRVLVTDALSIERSTGDITFDACDAARLSVTTDTGDVTGTLCSAKVFLAKTDTGRIRIPNTTTGGRCEITTDTGDIILALSNPQ